MYENLSLLNEMVLEPGPALYILVFFIQLLFQILTIVNGPNLPINIVKQINNLHGTNKCGVRPTDKPTVPKADIVSNTIDDNEKSNV